ncbi:MAG: hypothetical protein IKF79_02690 [Methanosphaera sp.]|nr:hypothetical protein [Methanosphaera sp.]
MPPINRDKIITTKQTAPIAHQKINVYQLKRTTKVITDYISDSAMKIKHHLHTPEAQEKYKDRMPNVEPRFAYNKYTLKYRQ